MTFLGFIAIPLIIVLVAYKLSDEIDWRKLAIMSGILVVFSGASMAICYYGNTHDVETWNGVILSKNRETVSCSHSYQCNPHSCNCDKSGKCSTCYDTCYHHSHDYDWVANTSNKEKIIVDRIDEQGTSIPSRWNAITIGEPSSVPHSFDNLIKGAPGTLFRKTGQEMQAVLPSYPKVYDYYRLNRLIAEPGIVSDQTAWNNDLSLLNARVGASKQVNAMVVITTQPREFFFALEQKWIGGKKNDAILVIGVDSDLKPVWTEMMAWVTDETFRVKVKDDVLNLSKIDRSSVLLVFESNIMELYHRKPMHDFAYLKASIIPTTTQWIVVLLIGVVISVGMIFIAINLDWNDGNHRFRR